MFKIALGFVPATLTACCTKFSVICQWGNCICSEYYTPYIETSWPTDFGSTVHSVQYCTQCTVWNDNFNFLSHCSLECFSFPFFLVNVYCTGSFHEIWDIFLVHTAQFTYCKVNYKKRVLPLNRPPISLTWIILTFAMLVLRNAWHRRRFREI